MNNQVNNKQDGVIVLANDNNNGTVPKKGKIFRYKLSDDIMAIISQFAKIHQFDDRHAYKEAWARWLVDQQDTVEREVMRLQQLDYDGDIIDKMFKAGRYYFREKTAIKKHDEDEDGANANVNVNATDNHNANDNANDGVKKDAGKADKRRTYIVMNHELIQVMDSHLQKMMKSNEFKPELAYIHFCDNHVELLRKEIGRLMNENKHTNISGNQMSAKFKKTYKNRYFILSSRVASTN
jgi:hypothetical protein